MRVAHFISTSGMYGAERWVLGLLNHLKKAEAILVCTSDSDLTLLNEAKRQGIPTRLIKIRNGFSIPQSIRKLTRLLRTEKIDILHTHGYKSDMIGLFAARKAKIRIISSPHGWSKDAGMKVMLYEMLDKQFLRFFDLVVPHTKALERSLSHIRRMQLVSNFVDLDSVPKKRKGDINLITYIGQLIERKRVEDIISSLTHIKNVRLQVIGDGIMKDDLKQLAKKLGVQDRVDFLGYRDDRLNLLNNSGVLILPSLLDWIPRVVMEAMTMEKLVIASDVPGIRPLIKHKSTGLLVPIKDSEQIAKAVKFAIDNPSDAGKIGKNARKLVEKDFSAVRAASEFDIIYTNICGGLKL